MFGLPTIAEVLDGIPETVAVATVKSAPEGVAIDAPHMIAVAKRWLQTCPVGTSGIDGNNTGFKTAAFLRDAGLSDETMLTLMRDIWNPRCEPEWDEGDLQQFIRSAENSAENERGSEYRLPASETFSGLSQAQTDETATLMPHTDSPATVPGADFGGVAFERMSDVKLQAITWLWKPRIPSDMLSLIGGDPDCGKSTLVAGLVAAVTKGGDMPLSGGKADKGSVLILNAEDGAAKVLGPRLVAAGADMRLIHRVKPMVRIEDGARVFDLWLDLPNLQAKMEELHKAGEPRVRLITIDPLNAYYGAGVDGNNASELRRLLTPLAEWAENNHVTIFGIQHLNKGNGSGNAINRLNGSHAVGAAARSVILVTPERGDDGQESGRFLFMRGKNNLAPRNIPNLAYRIEATPVTMADGSIEQHPRVIWDSEVAITAAEAFDPNYGKGNKQDKAEAFLLAVLADGPVAVEELRRMAAAAIIGACLMSAATRMMSLCHRSGHACGVSSAGIAVQTCGQAGMNVRQSVPSPARASPCVATASRAQNDRGGLVKRPGVGWGHPRTRSRGYSFIQPGSRAALARKAVGERTAPRHAEA